jgi:hypothetical protein
MITAFAPTGKGHLPFRGTNRREGSHLESALRQPTKALALSVLSSRCTNRFIEAKNSINKLWNPFQKDIPLAPLYSVGSKSVCQSVRIRLWTKPT